MRSLLESTETVAPLRCPVPANPWVSSCCYAHRRSAVPEEKTSGEMPLKTRKFIFPSTLKLCRPPRPVAIVPPRVTFVPVPTNCVRSKMTSFGVKETTRGETATSSTSLTFTARSENVAVPRNRPGKDILFTSMGLRYDGVQVRCGAGHSHVRDR